MLLIAMILAEEKFKRCWNNSSFFNCLLKKIQQFELGLFDKHKAFNCALFWRSEVAMLVVCLCVNNTGLWLPLDNYFFSLNVVIELQGLFLPLLVIMIELT